ncbi:diguanylate cyclase [Desulfobacterales bacterium HSG2]|nr:diguanylate cyclase [Desulfobacterales bacterium HSG2]
MCNNYDNKNFRILIVDDVSKNIQVVASILKDDGYQMTFAQNGKVALDKIHSHNFDLILLDVMMPGMDGFEVCRRLKQEPSTKDIPVVFLTAKTDTESLVRGFEAGGTDYVTKPFNGVELLARVRTRLELSRSRESLKVAYRELKKTNEELLKSQRKLELAAKTDTLTKLSNRRDIIEKIENERIRFERSGKPFSLVLCDIDNFKVFNDKHGHDCGDFVLVSVAEMMRGKVRKQDGVARWGGEEFLLLLPETDLEGGRILAESLREKISCNYYKYDNHNLRITMTFGVSSFSECVMNIEQCIKMADEALYEGKKRGKNCVVLSIAEQPSILKSVSEENGNERP